MGLFNKKKEEEEIKIVEPEEGDFCAEGVAHYLTQEDLDANVDEEIGNIGDLIYIPMTPEQADEYKIALEGKKEEGVGNIPTSNLRECTCGRMVTLPIEGEEPTICECGVKHSW